MSLKLSFISRYPPIEGGISAKTYWLARGLSLRGHEIHVITHHESAGREYCLSPNYDEAQTDHPITIHRPDTDTPWHIPEDIEQSLGLLDLSLRLVDEYGLMILDSGYLVPYGILGHLAKTNKRVRHVLRHGGSDIEKFLRRGIFGCLIKEAVSGADTVVTEAHLASLFSGLNERVVVQPPYVPDTKAFAPGMDSGVRGRLGFIGKINYHWEHKGLRSIAAIMQQLTGEFDCWFVCQGKGMESFQRSLDTDFATRVRWHPFIHPSKMPALLLDLDAIFVFEGALPHPVVSNLVLEAMSVGVGVITDRPDLLNTYREVFPAGLDQILVITPDEPKKAADVIRSWIHNRKRLPVPQQLFTFERYLSINEELYSNIQSF